ncbi:MAG: 50S ribosomal protein L10, partial [Firmicutes bacterium]|nr:50S ribosomal protein L10 [Bacillota bacterium]
TNKLEIKCGILNGQLISSDEVNTLAKIPSREELIGKLLFIFQNPMRSLAVAINEIAKKQA